MPAAAGGEQLGAPLRSLVAAGTVALRPRISGVHRIYRLEWTTYVFDVALQFSTGKPELGSEFFAFWSFVGKKFKFVP